VRAQTLLRELKAVHAEQDEVRSRRQLLENSKPFMMEALIHETITVTRYAILEWNRPANGEPSITSEEFESELRAIGMSTSSTMESDD
jgi:hypothetical protein